MNTNPPARIVGISPHSDDVALSTTHFLRMMSNVRGVQEFELVSCFTESEYAPFLDDVTTSRVTEIRRQEDLAFLERIGFEKTSLCSLGLLDAPLRPEWRADANVYDIRDFAPSDDAEIDGYARDLAALLASKRDDEALFLLPLGLAHKDHLITNRAALLALCRLPLLLYEDVPYAFRASEGEVQGRVAAARATLGEALSPVMVPHDDMREQWVACISAYASQFAATKVEQMADSFRASGRERLWANGRALSMLPAPRGR